MDSPIYARYYQYTTRHLDDDTTHNWRVRAIDTKSNYSSAVSFQGFVVRSPDAPDVDIAYDAVAEEFDITAG